MKTRLTVLVLLVACVSSVLAADDTIPRRFDFRFGGDPLWIAASDAITPAGSLRSDIVRPPHLERLVAERQKRLEAASAPSSEALAGEDSCDITFAERFTDGPDEGAVTSIEVLRELASTRLVIDGVVSSAEVGIHEGMPYTIVQIDTQAEDAPAGRIFLMYPKGRLRFGGMNVCNDDPAFSAVPAIGDPIAFIASYPLDSTGTLFSTSWIVYEHQAALVHSRRLDFEIARLARSVRTFAERLRASRHDHKQQ